MKKNISLGGGYGLSGQMMSRPLMISDLLKHASSQFATTEIVSKRVEGDIHRYTYSDCEFRARKVSQVLTRLGLQLSDRVGTLAWNGYRHIELYYGISGSGLVCHTINPRLFEDQIVFIINHAQDQVIFFDLSFLALVEKLQAVCPSVQYWVCMVDEDLIPISKIPNLLSYETLLSKESGDITWPVFDENLAAALCYTSGTTGNPKGALFSHRSTRLHAYVSALPDSFDLSASDTIMPVVPMFHVNAWGIPYSCPMVGAKLVLPGPQLDAPSLFELIRSEEVTMSLGVPTVWSNLLLHMSENGQTFTHFKKAVVGGSACPPQMMDSLNHLGVRVIHAWGMTELSPLGTFATLTGADLKKPISEQHKILQKQGRALFGIEMKIVDEDGLELVHDGVAFGNLMVKGSCVINNYFGVEESPLIDGWFPTGDVATIDAAGNMQITDRTKDVIKSGGEWISSIAIENIASAHPDLLAVACIAIAHPKWDERPLLVVVKKPNYIRSEQLLKEEIWQLFQGKMAKWCVPDEIIFIEEMPLTATGKIFKLKLRDLLKDFQFSN